MKPTSVIRELDHYGRLVIPSEMRRVLGQSDDEKIRVEIYTLDNKIFIQRVTPCCAFCDREDNLVESRGKMICKYCLNDLTKQI